MKRILSSLFVTSVAICSASVANAQATADSTHQGSVPMACSVTATNAILVFNATTPNLINSNSGGTFTTICNSQHTMRVEILSSPPSSSPAIPSGATYVQEFQLSGASSSYSGLNTNEFVTGPVSQTSLPLTTGTGYVLNVRAQGRINNGFILPAGPYTIVVRATATPG
jgi:hypothetical protein